VIISIFLLRTSENRPIAACLVGMGVGIYLFYQGFRLLQRRHLILNTPLSKIRSAPLGLVELSGLAVGPYTLVSPVAARTCYYYRTLVWEFKQNGKNKQWVKVAGECRHVPFFLDDNTGNVMIDPRGAELDLHLDFQQEFCDSFFTTKEEVPDNVRSLLLRHGVSTSNKIKVEEFCIKPKNALFVLGTIDENPGLELTPLPIQHDESEFSSGSTTFPLAGAARLLVMQAGGELSSGLSLTGGLQHDPAYDPIYDKAAASAASARVVRLPPSPASTKASDMTQQQKISAALSKAGITNPAAWAAAEVTSPGLAGDASLNNLPLGVTAASLDGFDPHPRVVLMKGKNNPTFLISWHSQRDLATSLGWKCSLMIWCGPALTLVSLYGFLVLTHLF